ncbi:unnamed protein product [Urochloa humidicola]
MPLSSSPSCLTLALLLALVTLTGLLPLAASSRGHGIGSTTDDRPALLVEPHDLLMMERFHGWMVKHVRSYATADEKLRRLEIYRQNVRFIEAANRDGRLSYTLGENKFTDLTHEEFLARYTSSRRRAPPPQQESMTAAEEEDTVITTRAGHVGEGSFLPAADEVPDRVDWAAKGKVTRIKSQGTECGACWAFSAVEAIESAYAIAKELEEPPVLSVQELIDCDVFDAGCSGGWPYRAFNWVMRNGGLALDSQYPYNKTEQTCKEKRRLPHVVSITNYGYVKPARSEKELMKAVARQPITVAFDATDECFRFYGGGVYDGMCLTDEGVYVGPCSDNKLIHNLNIVGYVNNATGDKYWIARNSWGEDWGLQGYALLKKDVPSPEGLCGIVTTEPSYPYVRS